MKPGELHVQKAVTRAFIEADAETVVLQRGAVTPDGAGGWRRNPPVALPPQTVRLIPSTSSRSVERTLADGRIVQPNFTVMGEVDLDIRVGDKFILWGGELEVIYVHQRNAYQTKAEVIRRG